MKILTIFGTRPEVIKIAPILNIIKQKAGISAIAWTTGQHREILSQMLTMFDITPSLDLGLMVHNQSLTHITSCVLSGLEKHLKQLKPDLILVQGDTTTAMASALAAFYLKIPVGHIEAGLRTGDCYSPFPEEMNRRLISQLATYHFAPTIHNTNMLTSEGIHTKHIHTTGNTVIDALFYTLARIKKHPSLQLKLNAQFPMLNSDKKMILVTCHRRENWGNNLESICDALIKIIEKHTNIIIVFPVHPNPAISSIVSKKLQQIDRIHLVAPANYTEFIYLMSHAYLILSDSGGVQEEAPSLGVPVLVLREHTERQEGIKAGVSRLIGAKKEAIIREVDILLLNSEAYQSMASAQNPYGDGKAAQRICDILIKIKQHGLELTIL